MAVWPPAAVVAALASLATGEARRTPPERLHVTMRFLGAVDADAVPVVTEAIGAAVGTGPRSGVTAALGGATATFGGSVLHVPVAGLDDLARVVAIGCRGFGGADDERPFVGHLAVARARRGRAADLRSLAGAVVPTEARVPWPVDDVTLVRSRSGPGGVRYEILAGFALSRRC